uniref:C2H2-type domain-containing protein n=1 Tax=Spumella elongata TaxID=89044 RepID=A0A7S3H9X4_9STRA|mmetsp:Transcript_41903/g.72817  ORF Transcript_41903/g.72817 Transcript_41903/m.72817 type:complete len:692 (+) Transcript_41903:447-2522(+)
MYDEYHQNYLQEFSDSFFRASKMEEWFQDRYNPIRIRDQDKAIAARAAVESAAIKASLLAQPIDTVKAMCLDPSTVITSNPLRAQSAANAEAAAVPADGEEPKEEVDVSAMESSSSVPLAGRALSGHTDRTLYISGIHAGCTKLALQNAITTALAAGNTEASTSATVPAPDRIILAQPMWTFSEGVNKFERFAWVVMPTVESAKAALALLFDLRVNVYAPVDPDQREPVIALSFSVHARPHLPKQYFEKHEHCGHHLRVQADLGRALELASLLDELRDVPAELRLATILEESAVIEALVKPTDKLDVTIAYLRRTHLVNYYGARKYRDESQLLQYAPSVLLREKEYVPLPEPVEGAMEEEAAVEETPAPSIGSKRKHRDEEEGEAEEGETEDFSADANAAPAVVDGMEVEAVAPAAPAARPVKKFPQVATSNPRVEAILVELRALVAAKEQRAANPELPGTADEEDAKVLLVQQEKTFDRCVETKLSQEKEGKCRCCYVSCAKLFKGLDFLTKHMHLKHEDFALDELLMDAEPFLRKRFEADPMNARPLPPVEVEWNNRTDLRSVKDLLAKHRTAAQQANSMNNRRGDRDYAAGQDNSKRGGADNRGNANSGRRGQDDRDRRISGGAGPSNHQAPQKMHYVEPRSEDNHARKISSYIDVDAPKESAVSIDYGVALPPIKKRKTVTTPKKVA